MPLVQFTSSKPPATRQGPKLPVSTDRVEPAPNRLRSLPAKPRVICLGHALKETLSAPMALKGLELGAELAGATVAARYCISDGGDGFLEATRGILPGRTNRAVVPGPYGPLAVTDYRYDSTSALAIVESAGAIGLRLAPPERRDIMAAGTTGLGNLLLAPIQMGAKQILVGLGGSATCDGGIGFLHALMEGLRFGTRSARFFAARDLENPPPIDFDFLREQLKRINIRVYCDVTNILTGPTGTAFNYAEQKGASRYEMRLLEYQLERWADRVEDAVGQPGLRRTPGAGAAGGLGFAFAAVGATLVPGAEAFCDLIHLNELLGQADGLLTCEGKFDNTSFSGKAPWHAAHMSQMAGKPSLIACGTAEAPAVEKAALIGVRVTSFADSLPRERWAAEAFSRLQEAARAYIRTGR